MTQNTVFGLYKGAQQALVDALSWSNRPNLGVEEFFDEVEMWYREFEVGNCSLGYAAAQIGLNKVDLMALLRALGWPSANM